MPCAVEAYFDILFREYRRLSAANLARIGNNKYIAETEPLKLEDRPKRVETILHISLQLNANLSIAFENHSLVIQQ